MPDANTAPAMRKLTSQETAAVLVGLRLYQARHGSFSLELDEIASNGGEFEPLDVDEVQELCEILNCGDVLVTDEDDDEDDEEDEDD